MELTGCRLFRAVQSEPPRTERTCMHRSGIREPLVLLHGVTCSARIWAPVIPRLSGRYDVIAPTAIGHRGGTVTRGPTRIVDVVDDAERMLDDLQLERTHLAGNSMGGWVAIELARRGRALSVCALSPAGCWQAESANHLHATEALKAVVRMTRLTRWALPALARSAVVRRFAMRDNAAHGERLTPAMLIDMADDLLGCTARDDLLATTDALAPLDPLPCPIMLAWSERDRIFPPLVNGAWARKLFPGAQWRLLPRVGHLPMLDDPALVAKTITESACRTTADSSESSQATRAPTSDAF